MILLVFAIVCWFVICRMIYLILQGKLLPTRVSTAICGCCFALMSTTIIPSIRIGLDGFAPYLSLYVTHMLIIITISSMLFSILYIQSQNLHRALGWVIGVGVFVGGIATWVYMTDMLYSPYTPNWTAFESGPKTLPRTLMASATLGYAVGVGFLSIGHNIKLYRREVNLIVKGRLVLLLLCSLVMVLFFGSILLKIIGRSLVVIDPVTTRYWLATLAALQLVGTGLWVAGRAASSFILWPWQVYAVFAIGSMQRQLYRFAPPLFLEPPTFYEKVFRPHQCLCQIVVDVLDSYHLLTDSSDPEAQQLHQMMRAEGLETKGFEEVIASCIYVSRQLRRSAAKPISSHPLPRKQT